MNDPRKIKILMGVGMVVCVVGLFLIWNARQQKERLKYTPLITKSEHERLMTEFSKIMWPYFKGEIDAETRDNQIEKLILAFNPKGDPKKEKHLRADIKLHSPLISSVYVMPLILKKAYGHKISAEEKKRMEGLEMGGPTRGGLDVETYLREQVKTIDPYIQKLKAYGITFKAETGSHMWGWNLGNKLTPEKLKKDARLYQAIAMLISPEIAKALADATRRKPIQIGNNLYLPPGREITGEEERRGK